MYKWLKSALPSGTNANLTKITEKKETKPRNKLLQEHVFQGNILSQYHFCIINCVKSMKGKKDGGLLPYMHTHSNLTYADYIYETPQVNHQKEFMLPFLDFMGPNWARRSTRLCMTMWPRSGSCLMSQPPTQDFSLNTLKCFICSNKSCLIQEKSVDGLFLSLLRGKTSSLYLLGMLWLSPIKVRTAGGWCRGTALLDWFQARILPKNDFTLPYTGLYEY